MKLYRPNIWNISFSSGNKNDNEWLTYSWVIFHLNKLLIGQSLSFKWLSLESKCFWCICILCWQKTGVLTHNRLFCFFLRLVVAWNVVLQYILNNILLSNHIIKHFNFCKYVPWTTSSSMCCFLDHCNTDYSCGDKTNQCYTPSERCNGLARCSNSYDEYNCSKFTFSEILG